MWQLLKRSTSFGRKDPRASTFGRAPSRRGISDLSAALQEGYHATGAALPPGLLKELEKRRSSEKPKLNVERCGLADADVQVLAGALAACPVLNKLELQRNSISDKGARVLLQLLKDQVALVAATPLEERLDCTFLAVVDLSNQQLPQKGPRGSAISPELLRDIQYHADMLATCNAVTSLRLSHIRAGAVVPVPVEAARRMHLEVVGRKIREGPGGLPRGASTIAYDELQTIVLRELTGESGLPELSPGQQQMLVPSSLSRQQSAAPVAGSGTESVSSMTQPQRPPPDVGAPNTVTAAALGAERLPLRLHEEEETVVAAGLVRSEVGHIEEHLHEIELHHREEDELHHSVHAPPSPPPSVKSSAALELAELRGRESADSRGRELAEPGGRESEPQGRESESVPDALELKMSAFLNRSRSASPVRVPARAPALLPSPSPRRHQHPQTQSQDQGSSALAEPDRVVWGVEAAVVPVVVEENQVATALIRLSSPSSDSADGGRPTSGRIVRPPSQINLLATAAVAETRSADLNDGNGVICAESVGKVENDATMNNDVISEQQQQVEEDRGSPLVPPRAVEGKRRGALRPEDPVQVPPGGARFSEALQAVSPVTPVVDLSRREVWVLDAPPASPRLASVLRLSLAHNRIQTLDCAALGCLPALEHLDLSHNGLLRIEGPVPPLRRLESADLSHNSLSDLSPLASWASLRRLDLSHNLVADPCGLPRGLRSVSLAHNRLSSALALRMLALATAVVSVDLRGNPVCEVGVSSNQGGSEQSWRVRLRSLMPQLTEVNGQSLRRPPRTASLAETSQQQEQHQQQVTREEQLSGDQRRVQQYALRLRLQEGQRLEQAEEMTQRARRTAGRGRPLDRAELQLLTARLTHRPPPKASAHNDSLLSAATAASAATTSQQHQQQLRATKAWRGEAEDALTECARAMRALFDHCLQVDSGDSSEEPVDDAQLEESARLQGRLSRAAAACQSVLDRGQALLGTAREGSKQRVGLERLVRQLGECAALAGELAVCVREPSRGALRRAVEAVMCGGSGAAANESLLRHYHSNSNNTIEEEDGLRSLRARLVQRAVDMAAPAPIPRTETEPARVLEDEEAARLVQFTDTVMQTLRARLAAISRENGRPPDLDDDQLPPPRLLLPTAAPTAAGTAAAEVAVVSVEKGRPGSGEKENAAPNTPTRADAATVAVPRMTSDTSADSGVVLNVLSSQDPTLLATAAVLTEQEVGTVETHTQSVALSGGAPEPAQSTATPTPADETPTPQESPAPETAVTGEVGETGSRSASPSMKDRLRARLAARAAGVEETAAAVEAQQQAVVAVTAAPADLVTADSGWDQDAIAGVDEVGESATSPSGSSTSSVIVMRPEEPPSAEGSADCSPQTQTGPTPDTVGVEVSETDSVHSAGGGRSNSSDITNRNNGGAEDPQAKIKERLRARLLAASSANKSS